MIRLPKIKLYLCIFSLSTFATNIMNAAGRPQKCSKISACIKNTSDITHQKNKGGIQEETKGIAILTNTKAN